MRFLKESWKKDFITYYLLAYIFGIILFTIHLSYNLLHWLQWALGVPLIFFILYWFASKYLFPRVSSSMEKLSEANNISYNDAKSNGKLLDLIDAHAFYFAIFYVYFFFVLVQYQGLSDSGFEYNLFLFFIGGLAVIFIRTVHYADPKIGSKIGETVAYFFFPFGLILAAAILYNFTGGKDIAQIFLELISNWQVVPYFLMLLSITLAVDVCIDAKVKYDNIPKTEKEKIRRIDNLQEKNIIEYHETLYSTNNAPKIEKASHISYKEPRKRISWEGIETIEKNINEIHKKKYQSKDSEIDKKVDGLLSNKKK